MTNYSASNRRKQLLAAIIFGGLGLIALSVFCWGFGSLASSLVQSAPVITFNTGIFRFLGVALISIGIASYAAVEWRLRAMPSARVTKLLTRIMIAGLALMFLLPHGIHFPLEKYLFNQGYKICQPKSYANRAYRSVAYAIDVPACIEGLEDKFKVRR
ncbi:MAG: hypothetical protein NVV73_15775 [Cellvibrionaceae bacterium]|nr:hypothetical protein [Cellvibrionaceae bacterium]